MKPAANIMGITHHVRTAPPVSTTSVTFIATSIPIIEIKDIPIAILKASLRDIWLERIIVSRMIDVIRPLTIAKLMIAHTGQAIPMYWK